MNVKKYKSGFRIMAEAYFKQPVFNPKIPASFNPFKFRKDYRIKLLECCWQLDYEIEVGRLRLENCWQKASLESSPAGILQS
ncbi:MAG: hypothetical protein AAGE59_30560 [Cyanobacteria bacterium P01_F01_bin.86]